MDIPLILRHSSCLRDHHERDDRDVDDRDVDDRDGGVDGDGELLMMMRTSETQVCLFLSGRLCLHTFRSTHTFTLHKHSHVVTNIYIRSTQTFTYM